MSKAITQEEFERRIFDIYKGRYSIVGKYKKTNIPIQIRCNKCGTIFERTPNHLTSKKVCYCPVCDYKKVTTKVIPGVNDLATIRPDIAKLLNNQDDATKHRTTTRITLEFKCPDCGKVFHAVLPNVVRDGFSCIYCGDKKSYPNKFMANLLDLNHIEFEQEFIIKPYDYRYDFYFKLDNVKYLVEMDGAYGHGEVNVKNRTIEEQIYADNMKTAIANENGYELIRIDCKYKNISKRFEYISNSLASSLLANIIDLNESLLKKADNTSKESITVAIANKWNEGIRSYDELSKIFHIKRPSIRKQLERCCKIGLIDMEYQKLLKEIRLSSNVKLSKSKGKRVKCNETGDIYHSVAHAERETGFGVKNYFYKKTEVTVEPFQMAHV